MSFQKLNSTVEMQHRHTQMSSFKYKRENALIFHFCNCQYSILFIYFIMKIAIDVCWEIEAVQLAIQLKMLQFPLKIKLNHLPKCSKCCICSQETNNNWANKSARTFKLNHFKVRNEKTRNYCNFRKRFNIN